MYLCIKSHDKHFNNFAITLNMPLLMDAEYTTIIPRFTNASVPKLLGSPTAVSKILLLFVNFALGDEHGHDHLPHVNSNVAIFPRIVEQIKLINQGP